MTEECLVCTHARCCRFA